MTDISKIKLPGSEQVYNIKDTIARERVTSVTTGNGLTGGPITSTGTISIDNSYVSTTGHSGLAPQLPSSEASDKFLSGDGTWKKVSSISVSVSVKTIGIGSTSTEVPYTGTFVNAYAIDANNKLVITDINIGASSVVFSLVSGAADVLTCKVVSIG